MGLVANSRDLSLHDLLQVKEMSRATCRIFVTGSDAEGALYVQLGEVVFATYGRLSGEAAAHAILAQSNVHYQVTSDVTPPKANMRARPAALVMEAMRQLDEGGPLREREPAWPAVVELAEYTTAPPARRRPKALVAAAIAVVALVGAAAAGVLVFRGGAPSPAPIASAEPLPMEGRPAQQPVPLDPAAGAVESSALHPPVDSLPVLVTSVRPRTPDVALALKPSIVCRLLVDRSGAVVRATVYQQRSELAAFEAAALEAAKQLRFEPGRQAGREVAVWINWPVRFE